MDAARNDGATPLCIASEKGHLDVVDRLLSAGAGVDAATNTGATPLYVASQNGRLEVVDRLLSAGAGVPIVLRTVFFCSGAFLLGF